MKKRTSLFTGLLALTLAFLMAFAAPLAAIAGELVIDKYDVDENGTQNITDATALLDKLSGGDEVNDLNGDGVGNISDVTKLLDYLAGKYTASDILDAAYALAPGETLGEQGETFTLSGTVTSIDTAYSAQYQNVTVTMTVDGDSEQRTIKCFRLKGEGADVLAVGSQITVTGPITNYNGTVEFNTGCTLDAILDFETQVAYELSKVEIPASVTDTATVSLPTVGATYTDIQFVWSADDPNTADISYGTAAGTPCTLTLTAGQTASDVTVSYTAIKDKLTVSGDYTVHLLPAGTVETMQDIVDAAYALETNTSLSEAKTLTGVITQINSPYAEQYHNITVTITVENRENNPIQCYRLKNGADITAGEGVEVIKVGDTITVTGTLKNYNGTIEFDTGCTLDSVDEVYQMSDAEKVQTEYDALSITPADGTQLPSTGETYTDVAITWTSSNDTVVSVTGGVIAVDNSTLTEATDVTLTATVSLNNAVMTKTFTIGVSAPTGDDTVAKTWTLTFPGGNSGANTNYTGEWTATIDGQTWTLVAINNGGDSTNGWTAVRAGRKSDTSVATVTTTIDGTVETVVLNLTQVDASKTNSIKLYVKDADGATLATVDIDSVSVGEHTFSVPAAVRDAGLTYVLEFDLLATANGFTRFDSVVYNGFAEAVDPGECNHTYGAATYEWASDHSTCTATATCTICGDVATETVNAVTTTAEASVTYTATFTNALFAEQTYTEQTGAPDTLTLTFPDYNDTTVSAYTSEWTATVGTQVWTLTNFNNNSSNWAYVKCGRKTYESVGTIATAVEGKVLTVSVTIDAITAANVNSIKLIVTSGNDVKTYTLNKETGTQTVTILAADQFESATYTLEFDCAAGSSNGLVTVSRVEITLGDGDTTGTSPDASCEHTYGTPTYEWANDHSTCTATAVCSLCNGAVTETVTAVTTTGEGTVTYTATFTNALFTAQTYTEQTSSATALTLTFPTYNDESVGAYNKTWTATVDGQVWTLTNFNNNNSNWTYVKCGSKNAASIGTIATDVTGKVHTVSVTIDQLTAAKVNSIKLIVTSGNDAKTYTLNAATGTQTVTILAADQFDSATYTLEFDCAQGTSNGLVTVSEVVITPGDGDTTGTSPDAGIDPATCDHTYGEVTYEWANDHSTCTASHVCTICGSTETETVQTTSAAATDFNGTVYTATFENPDFYIAVNNVYDLSGEPVTASVTFSQNGYANQQEVTSVAIGDAVITFDKGTNSNTPKYFTSGTAVRVYGGGTATVTAPNGCVITSIVIDTTGSGANNTLSANVGTYANGTWTGSASTVIFTVAGTSGNARFVTVTVTYEEA